jgi:hypothetical protein
MANNGEKETEHPKPLIEVLKNTKSAIEDYASAKNIPISESAQVLILNELRCIHFHLDHLDTMMSREEGKHADSSQH